jgi:hypothetical protein
MPKYIVKVSGKYLEYSTIVDAFVSTPMTLEEFKEFYIENYGRHGMESLEDRLERVEAKGTSCFMDDSAEDTLSGNRMLDEPRYDGERRNYSMTWDEIEALVNDPNNAYWGVG